MTGLSRTACGSQSALRQASQCRRRMAEKRRQLGVPVSPLRTPEGPRLPPVRPAIAEDATNGLRTGCSGGVREPWTVARFRQAGHQLRAGLGRGAEQWCGLRCRLLPLSGPRMLEDVID